MALDESWLEQYVPTEPDTEESETLTEKTSDDEVIQPSAKKPKYGDGLEHEALSKLSTLVPVVFRPNEGCQKAGIFLSLYGGRGHICESQKVLGRMSFLVDLEHNVRNDLCTDAAHRDVLALLRATCRTSGKALVCLLGIGVTCQTWSMARGGGGTAGDPR